MTTSSKAAVAVFIGLRQLLSDPSHNLSSITFSWPPPSLNITAAMKRRNTFITTQPQHIASAAVTFISAAARNGTDDKTPTSRKKLSTFGWTLSNNVSKLMHVQA